MYGVVRRSLPFSSVRFGLVEILAGLLLTLAAAFAVWCLTTNLMRPQLNGHDEGVYLMVARLLFYGYPHSAFFFDQPFGFPQILAYVFHLFGDTAQAGRLTVVAFSVLGLVGMGLLTWQLGAKWAAPLAVLFALTNHYFLDPSRFTLADVPGAALLVWAMVMMLAFRNTGSRRWLVASALFCTIGLTIKPLDVGFCVPIAYWMITRRLVRDQARWRFDARAFGLDVAVFGAVGLLAAAPFVNLLNLVGEFQRTVGFHLAERNYYSPRLVMRQVGLDRFLTSNALWLGLAGLGAFTASLRYPSRALPLLGGTLSSVLLLLQLPPWGHHYTLLVPPLSVFAAVGVNDGISAVGGLVRAWRARHDVPAVPRRSVALAAFTAVVFLVSAAVWLQAAPGLVSGTTAVLNESSRDPSTVVSFLRKNFRRGTFFLGDNAMVLFLAGDLLPPSAINLAYQGTFSFSGQAFSKLEESIKTYHVQGVVVIGGYNRNAELTKWINANFPVARRVNSTAHNHIHATIHLLPPPST